MADCSAVSSLGSSKTYGVTSRETETNMIQVNAETVAAALAGAPIPATDTEILTWLMRDVVTIERGNYRGAPPYVNVGGCGCCGDQEKIPENMVARMKELE